jgi:hypothetical protein
MFARFLRRRHVRRYFWHPAVDPSTRHVSVTVMEFGH